MSSFWGPAYVAIGLVVAVAALVVGCIAAQRESSDTTEHAMLTFLAVICAPLVGGGWLVVLLVAAIVLPSRWAKQRAERAARRTFEQERQPKPPTDVEKYARMAREQRNLARGSRDNGWDDTAVMQDQLAEQYEHLSRMYERTTP